jgi:hypothetical protein
MSKRSSKAKQKNIKEVEMRNDVNYISVDSVLIMYTGYLKSLKFKNHIFEKNVPVYIPKELAEHIMARSYLGTQFELVKEDREPVVEFVPEEVVEEVLEKVVEEEKEEYGI